MQYKRKVEAKRRAQEEAAEQQDSASDDGDGDDQADGINSPGHAAVVHAHCDPQGRSLGA